VGFAFDYYFADSLALHCGLCISGQTISDCTRAL